VISGSIRALKKRVCCWAWEQLLITIGLNLIRSTFRQERHLNSEKVNLFVMSSWGYNIKSGSVAEFSWWGGRTITKQYSGGVYGEIGGGNIIRIRKKERLQLSVSWVMKAVEESFQSEIWNPVNQSPRTITNLNRYTMNRTALRVGWKF